MCGIKKDDMSCFVSTVSSGMCDAKSAPTVDRSFPNVTRGPASFYEHISSHSQVP